MVSSLILKKSAPPAPRRYVGLWWPNSAGRVDYLAPAPNRPTRLDGSFEFTSIGKHLHFWFGATPQ
jgi:hypothetical protein